MWRRLGAVLTCGLTGRLLAARTEDDYGSFVIPHPNKVQKGGEDAHFHNAASGHFGVADGVGGWNNVGVDPKEYAVKLMKYSKKACLQEITPSQILNQAYRKVSKENILGSSTAVICQIIQQKLVVVSVGDSGVRVLRQNQEGRMITVFATEEQCRGFNSPYQLGRQSPDRPDDGLKYEFKLQRGDIVIAGSDGLFDNIFNEGIDSLVTKFQDENASFIAEKLAQRAFKISNGRQLTPFSLKALSSNVPLRGGKLDDITVVVVKHEQASSKL